MALLVLDGACDPLDLLGVAVSSGNVDDCGIRMVAEEDLVDVFLSVAAVDIFAEDVGDGLVDDLVRLKTEKRYGCPVPLHDVADLVDGETGEGEFVEQGLKPLEAGEVDLFELGDFGFGPVEVALGF